MTPPESSPPRWRDIVFGSALLAALVAAGMSAWVTHETIDNQKEIAHDQVAAQLVGIAANVLTSQGKVDPDARTWARNVINHYSPIKLGDTTTLPPFHFGGEICTPDGPAAIVSPTGLVGACHPGTAVITLRAGDQTAKTTVTVGPPRDSTQHR